jgi:hypothetical protein
MTSTIRWVTKKDGLPEDVLGRSLGTSFVMSMDSNETGAKMFAAFDDALSAARYVSRHPGDPLNEVLVDAARPLHGVCDCDRPDVTYSTPTVVGDLLAAWNAFLLERCSLDLKASPGNGCQISTATTAIKTSVHIKFDFIVPSMTAHKDIAKQLVDYVLGSRQSYPSLVYDLVKQGQSKPMCVIDTAIYTHFRSWRMLGMTKLDKANPLVAYPGCSTKASDHFVGVYTSLPSPAPLPVLAPNAVPSAPGVVARRPRNAPVSRAATAPTIKRNLAQYESVINAWPGTLQLFGKPVTVVAASASADAFGIVSLRADKDTMCPYAGRPHASNNLYLKYSEQRQHAFVMCHDEDCREAQHNDPVYLTGGSLPGANAFSHDHVYRDTMHSQQENVVWDERYNEPQMRPLPLKALVTVRANMAVGKTKATVAMLRRECTKASKVLLVSYSRALCSKYSATFTADLPDLGFVNYIDTVSGSPINSNCIIVCLDSLWRVTTRNFDFFIIDEAASVLAHFNSPLMKRAAEITGTFELLCLQAAHIYFLDAVVDSTAVRAFVDYVCRHKGVQSYDIWNEHVRESNRIVDIVTC